jgi:hypothetical protein
MEDSKQQLHTNGSHGQPDSLHGYMNPQLSNNYDSNQ